MTGDAITPQYGTMDFLNIFTPCLLMKTVNILSDYAGNESSLFHFCKHFMRRIWFGSATVEILSAVFKEKGRFLLETAGAKQILRPVFTEAMIFFAV